MTGFELPPAMVFVLIALASARMFRLLAFDVVTQRLRDYLEVYVFSRSAWLKEGFYCPWCLGWHLALGWTITALAWHDTILWQLAAISFSANYLAATLNGLYDVVHETAEDLLNADDS